VYWLSILLPHLQTTSAVTVLAVNTAAGTLQPSQSPSGPHRRVCGTQGLFRTEHLCYLTTAMQFEGIISRKSLFVKGIKLVNMIVNVENHQK
jgi:hypothetical protein